MGWDGVYFLFMQRPDPPPELQVLQLMIGLQPCNSRLGHRLNLCSGTFPSTCHLHIIIIVHEAESNSNDVTARYAGCSRWPYNHVKDMQYLQHILIQDYIMHDIPSLRNIRDDRTCRLAVDNMKQLSQPTHSASLRGVALAGGSVQRWNLSKQIPGLRRTA